MITAMYFSPTKTTKKTVEAIAGAMGEYGVIDLTNPIARKMRYIYGEDDVISPERANIYIPEDLVPKIIGKNGKRIAEIEEKIGISLGVEVIEDKPINTAPFEIDITHTNKQLILELGKENGRKNFDIHINGEYLLTATTSKKGEVKLKKGTELADFIIEAIEMGLEITAIEKM